MAELSIAEAAAHLGVSVDTIRRRIRRGELEARTASGGRLVVAMPGEADQPSAGAAEEEAVPNEENSAEGGVIEGLRAELERSRWNAAHMDEMLEELRRQRDQLESTVTLLREQLEAARQAQQADATERSELRLLLARAQQQLGNLLPPPSKDGDGAQQPPSRSWWRWWS